MTDIVYEHPLNEQARVYLRLDALLNQVTVARNQAEMPYISLFRGLFDLQEILEQVQVKADLAKDLDKQRQRLRSLMDIPHVDQAMLKQILAELDACHKAYSPLPGLVSTCGKINSCREYGNASPCPAAVAVSMYPACTIGFIARQSSNRPIYPAGCHL